MDSELWYQLPPDMSAWNTAIVENMARKLPELPAYINSITWSKLDPVTGDGEGLVEFMNGIAAAPIIIKGNKLAPVDIVATNTGAGIKFYPLAPVFLQKIYADNVIGEPVQNATETDEDYVGPSKKIKHIKTVDAVKYASVDTAKQWLAEIDKVASVANWFAEKMPETLIAIYNRANEVEEQVKEASIEAPELMMFWSENGKFFANGEEMSSEDIGAICKFAGVSAEDRVGLMNGKPIVVDNREKTARIHIPYEQDVTSISLNDEDIFSDGSTRSDIASPAIAVTDAYLRTGEVKRGIIFSHAGMHGQRSRDAWSPLNGKPSTFVPEVDEFKANEPQELFVCNEGYGINDSIKTSVRTPVEGKVIIENSDPVDPAVGMMCLVMSLDGYFTHIGRIMNVRRYGQLRLVTIYDIVDHKEHEVKFNNLMFIEIPDVNLSVVRPEEKSSIVTGSGINCIVRKGDDGRIILDGESHSLVNCPFALMNKYAAAYDDAKAIVDIANDYGMCAFEVMTEESVKTAAFNDNPDATKKNRKGTKAGSDDENPTQQSDAPQLQQMTPEAQMSVGQSALNGAPGAGQAGNSAMVQPISSKDLETLVQVNSPKAMDAYMLGNLAQSNNLTSREQIVRTSDSILDAIGNLSQMLFLVRNGSTQYVSENDIQSALSKLSDVAQAIGISNSQVGGA